MAFGMAKENKEPKDEGEKTREADEDTPSGDPVEDTTDGDAPVDAPSATDGQAEEGTPYRPMSFRPAFLDEAASGEDARATPAATPPQGDAFFVSVTRDGATETHRIDDPAETQALLERLMDEEVPEEDVTVFSGHRVAFTVNRRPVVKLLGDQED